MNSGGLMSYSINLLWVNLDPQDREANTAQNIFGDGLSTDKEDQFIDVTQKWRHLNPEAPVHLWFDSALVTQVALDKTRERFSEIGVKLRDVRQLPNLKGELKCAMHPGVPVYFRVDLLKELIGSHMAQKESEYAVFTDLDITPMDRATLFDARTKGHLEKYGYVYNAAGISNIENSFFIYKNSPFLKEHTSIFLKSVSDRISRLRPHFSQAGIHTRLLLTSSAIFNDLYELVYHREHKLIMKAADSHKCIDKPRKKVECPPSQFDFGGFSKEDHRSETAHFAGNRTYPFTAMAGAV